jgi:hypothetical protein
MALPGWGMNKFHFLKGDEVVQAAMNSGVWFHIILQYNNALEHMEVAFCKGAIEC